MQAVQRFMFGPTQEGECHSGSHLNGNLLVDEAGVQRGMLTTFCRLDSTERVKKVQSQLRSEQRSLDREMRQIDQGSIKTKAEIKKLAKKGDVKNAKILAREVVRANKQKNRLAVSKARLNSINMQLQHQLGKRLHCSHEKSEQGTDIYLFRVGSHVQSDRQHAKVDRDYETLKPTRQTARSQRDHATDVCRDDQGKPVSPLSDFR